MIPVYVFYSMFGFQRTGDQMWALGDQLGRGFLLGATAGRTTLNGEGLQHEDGHSLLLASTNPACVAYDPAWAFEIALHRRRTRCAGCTADRRAPDGEDVFYYLTVYNEPYQQPAEPERTSTSEGILRGLYRYAGAGRGRRRRRRGRRSSPPASAVPLGAGGAGAARRGVGRGGRRLVGDLLDRAAPRRAGLRGAQPAAPGRAEQRVPYVTPGAVRRPTGPVVAVSDWMRAVPDQIAPLGAGRLQLARHRRLRPLGHPAARCAATSTSTPSRSCWRC